MSASEPNKKKVDGRPFTVRRRLSRWSRRDPWFLVSMGLHGLILAVLVYLTPVRQIVQELRQASHPVSSMSARELANLAETIEAHAADQIASNARELGTVFGDITEIQDGIGQKFASFEQRQRENAARDALQAMEQAAEQMRGAVKSIQEDSDVQATDRFQALAEGAQERAGKKLELVGSGAVSLTTGQRAAGEAHQQAKAVHDQRSTQAVRVGTLERSVATEQTRTEQARQALEQAKESRRPQDQVDRTTRLAEQQKRFDQAAEDLKAGRQAQERLHSQEAESQKQALVAQEEVMGALRKALEGQSGGGSGGSWSLNLVAGLSQPGAGPGARSPAAGPQGAGGEEPGDVAQLYASARALEDGIAERFKEVRAMDLAMVRDMTLEDARKDIEVIRPVRPDLNVELLREAARTDEGFEAHKEEVRTALRETSSMVNLAHRMLEMATQSVEKMKFGTNVQLAPEEQTPDFRLIIRDLAMEEVSGKFSDLAGMMRALEGDNGENGEGTGGRTGAGAGGAGGRGSKLDYQDLTSQEEGGAASLPRFGDAGPGEGGLMPELRPDVPAVGARKISPDGRPGNWMFIDSWYTVGPFPNPNRVNIDREFPPDSLVDLDATYVGKDGRKVRWQFVQSDVPEVRPPNAEPYGIWYAYTEFYCDRSRDVIIALGTDDRGTLKINGLPVWISSKQLKGWDIDEVWRRVHLNQGINRILYRVENGWQTMGFSLILRLEET